MSVGSTKVHCMDFIALIQSIFSQMNCPHCHAKSAPKSIRLIREEDGMYVVTVQCAECHEEVAMAMVGIEIQGDSDEVGVLPHPEYQDPELTESELDRIEGFSTISHDDVLDAHTFFKGLGRNWQSLIPAEMRERCTVTQTESPAE